MKSSYSYRSRFIRWSGVSSSDGSDEIGKYLSRLVLDFELTIQDGTSFDTFWEGGYTAPAGQSIEKHYIGIAITRGDAIRFWMMRNLDGVYMDSSFGNCNLFNVAIGDAGIALYGNKKLYTKTFTWDGVSLRARIVVDWDVFESKSSNLSNNYFDNDVISVSHPGIIQDYELFSLVDKKENDLLSRIGCNPVIVKNYSEPKNKSVRQAVIDMRLTLVDGSGREVSKNVYDNFWGSGFTFGGVSYPEKYFTIAYCGVAEESRLAIYFANENGNYLSGSGNSLVALGLSDSNKIKLSGDLELWEKVVYNSTVGATIKVQAVVDVKYIKLIEGTFNGNLLYNELISIDHSGPIFEHKIKKKDLLPDFTSLVMGVDGDSITEGNQWSKYVADILGVAAHQNVGVGSARYACKQVVYNGVTYTTQEYDDPNFAGIAPGTITIDSPEAAQKTANNVARCHIGKFIANVTAGTYSVPDIFCFAFGTNDSVPTDDQVNAAISGSALPSIADSLDMAGGLRYAVQKIMQTYPNCKIFILLPIQSANATRNANNLLKIEAIKKVARAMSVTVIDMYSNCGIAGLLETGTGPYLSDGLHPNDAGRKLMGAFAAEQIIALYGRKIS